MNSLQYFNIRLFSLSAKVAGSLGLTVSGFAGDSSINVERELLFLEISARNSAWRETMSETGTLAHVTVEGVGLIIQVVSSSVDVSAAASFSSIFASTVNVKNARAQYKVDITRLPGTITDAILSGLTLAGPVSSEALTKIGEALNEKWPALIRKDPASLRFREIQLHPVKPPNIEDKLRQARQISDVARGLAGGKNSEQIKDMIAGWRAASAAKKLAYDGPSELLAEAVYATFGAGKDDPEASGAAGRARTWLHHHDA